MPSRLRILDFRQFQIAFGTVIRRHRLARDISQEAFASRCDLHRTYISLIERGEKAVSLKALISIANALGERPHILIQEAEASV